MLVADDLEDVLVDRVLAEEAEGEHAARLPHAVGARDRLVLDRGLVLRLAEDDDARALDVHAGSARLDLRHQHRSGFRGVKLLDDLLPPRGRDGSVDETDALVAQ